MMGYDNGEDEYKERGSVGESWAVESVVWVAGLQDSVWEVVWSVPECCWGVLGESSRLPTEIPESVLWLRPLAVHGSSSGSASSSSCSHWSSDSSKGNDRRSHGSTACCSSSAWLKGSSAPVQKGLHGETSPSAKCLESGEPGVWSNPLELFPSPW